MISNFNITEVQPIKAARVRDIDGFAIECSCGLVIKNSLIHGVIFDAQKHIDWHNAEPSRRNIKHRKQRNTTARQTKMAHDRYFYKEKF